MFDYNSPIEIIMKDLKTEIDNQTVKAVQNVGITVDKEELLKALNYDREEYEKGYVDAKSEIVHCKDCKHYSRNNVLLGNVCKRTHTIFSMKENDFCSYGESKKSDNVIRKR